MQFRTCKLLWLACVCGARMPWLASLKLKGGGYHFFYLNRVLKILDFFLF